MDRGVGLEVQLQPLNGERVSANLVWQSEKKRREKGPKQVRGMKLQRTGISIIASTVVGAALLVQGAFAQTVTLESWEGTMDGWTVPQGAGYFTPTFSSATGVTDGTYSLALTEANGGAGENYGQMLLSPFESAWTAALGNATSLSLDIYTPPGSFGYYLQFDVDVNNADIGYQSIDGYSYPATSIGSEYTLTIPIPAGIAAGLAASSNPTQIAIQVGGGYTSPGDTMNLDNLRVFEVPEPSTIAMLGFGLLGLVCLRPRRVS